MEDVNQIVESGEQPSGESTGTEDINVMVLEEDVLTTSQFTKGEINHPARLR